MNPELDDNGNVQGTGCMSILAIACAVALVLFVVIAVAT